MQQSNLLIARFSLIILLCIARDVFWTAPYLRIVFFGAQPEVEQPGSSVLVFVPYIQHIATALNDKLGFKRLRLGRPGRRLDTELDGSLRTRGPQTVLASRYPVRPSGVIVFAL